MSPHRLTTHNSRKNRNKQTKINKTKEIQEHWRARTRTYRTQSARHTHEKNIENNSKKTTTTRNPTNNNNAHKNRQNPTHTTHNQLHQSGQI